MLKKILFCVTALTLSPFITFSSERKRSNYSSYNLKNISVTAMCQGLAIGGFSSTLCALPSFLLSNGSIINKLTPTLIAGICGGIAGAIQGKIIIPYSYTNSLASNEKSDDKFQYYPQVQADNLLLSTRKLSLFTGTSIGLITLAAVYCLNRD